MLAKADATVKNMETQASKRHSTKRRAPALVATVLVAGSLTLSGCFPSAPSQNDPKPHLSIAQSPIMNGYNTTRDQALLTMEVLSISSTSRANYSPEPFKIDQALLATEAGWAEPEIINENCTIPNAAVARDGVEVKANENTCEITKGLWFDPLTGETVARDEVSAKPFLPTERAWSSGASAWTNYQFSIYRNSPQSVMTISDEAYNERGQRGPDKWRPADKELWCGYALRWVSEKNTFGLYLESQAEADALHGMLGTCPDEGFTEQTA